MLVPNAALVLIYYRVSTYSMRRNNLEGFTSSFIRLLIYVKENFDAQNFKILYNVTGRSYKELYFYPVKRKQTTPLEYGAKNWI